MMTCKEVSRRLMRDETAGVRIAVWMHLMMCRHCRALRRQLDLLMNAARIVGDRFERELAPDFASQVVRRLERIR